MELFFVLVALTLIGGLGSAVAASNLAHAVAYGAGLLVLLIAYLCARRLEQARQEK